MVNINGEDVSTSDKYDGNHQESAGNIILMSNGGLSRGAVTDVNLWKRILTAEEIRDWQFCRTKPGEISINWDTAELHVNLMEISDVDKTETCLKKPAEKNYVAFTVGRTLDESVIFCKGLGGELAVIRDEESAREIGEVCPTLTHILTGFRREEGGQWTDVVKGEKLRWTNWASGNPRAGKRFGCQVLRRSTGELEIFACEIHTQQIF